MSMSNRKDQGFIKPHRSTEMFVSVNQDSTHLQDAEKVALLTRPTLVRQDAPFTKLRSRFALKNRER
jgi:hypothetical protein